MIEPALQPIADFMERGIPFNRFIGIRVDALSKERCVLRVPWNDNLIGDPLRPSVHGGVTSSLIDTTGGGACFASLADPERAEVPRISTVDLRVDYLRPTAGQDLVCEGRVVRMGNRVAVLRMEVFAGEVPELGTPERQAPIATGQAVYNILRGS